MLLLKRSILLCFSIILMIIFIHGQRTTLKTLEGMEKEVPIIVHLIPHTHDDAGWQVSVDEYQLSQVDVILDNVILQLEENKDRRFVYAETNFFASWFRRQSLQKQNRVRQLVQQGRLEIVNGGWVQHDEAGPLFQEMIDQTTRGHLWLMKNLNIRPSVAWQLDPFGHSNTQAWLMSAKTGLKSLFFGRSDYRELEMRYANSSLEYFWQASKTFQEDAKVFTVQLYGQGKYGGYYSWYPFEETNAKDTNYVQDDETIQGYNVKEWVEKIVTAATHQAKQTKTPHQLWMLGNDFTYQSASRWFQNYDKLIRHVNEDGRIRIMYSTPSKYIESKLSYFGANTNVEFETRKETDLFPLADGPHEYWTGYFTSRPSLKRQYRYASAFLTAARQIETYFKQTYPNEVQQKTKDRLHPRNPTTPVGNGWTDDLEGALGIVSHHDGVSGTARQSVTNDYAYRLSLGSIRAEKGTLHALEKIAGIAPSGGRGFCNCNVNGQTDCINNLTSCLFTATRNEFTIVIWNSNSFPLKDVLIEIPVSDNGEYEVSNGEGSLPVHLVKIDGKTKSLPLLYLNAHGLTPIEKFEKKRELQNIANYRLTFVTSLPSVGFSAVRVIKSKRNDDFENANPLIAMEGEAPKVNYIENEYFKIELNPITHQITSVINKRINKRFPFGIEWGYYRSSIGGCSKEKPDPDACYSQASGAYLFRPNNTRLHESFSIPIESHVVSLGEKGMEIVQTFSSYISHTIRLFGKEPPRIEFTVGPIPIDDGWGKEIVVRYQVKNIQNERIFYTDSNGRETVKRVVNYRSGEVCALGGGCKKSLLYEPISSNYYPVNSFIALNDSEYEMNVVVDATHGGTSLKPGEIELMTHRRLLKDDYRGVEEPLNETMCGCGDINARPGEMGQHGHLGDGGCDCVGLTIRGKHYLILDEIDQAREKRREFSDRLMNPPQLAFFENEFVIPRTNALNESIILKKSLPPSIRLLTFCSNYENGTLIRFSHSFEVDEHPIYSKPAKENQKDYGIFSFCEPTYCKFGEL